ncbi:MAG: LytR/AlgR family response regulator transcription factor [Bacteroidota bacterium]
MITCIAVDDEPKALDVIRHHASKIGQMELLETFTDPLAALQYLQDHRVQLLLMDIDMPEVDGMAFVKQLKNPPLTIFTTAHREYAVESYSVGAVDYLMKPFTAAQLMSAVIKAKQRLRETPMQDPDIFFVNTGNQKRKLSFSDVLCVQAEGNYVMYITRTERVIVRSSIAETLTALPHSTFVQIHRSTIVSLRHIDKVEDNHVYLGKEKYPVSDTYRKAFFERLKLYQLPGGS